MMVNFDPEISIEANWEAGDHLSDAWFLFSSERHRAVYRGSESDSDIRAATRMLMELEVQHRLGVGELTALALQSRPVSNGEPTAIPSTYFKSPGIEIDWDLALVRWNEHYFADATIVVGRLPSREQSDAQLLRSRLTNPIIITGRSPGRPSFTDAIDRAIVALDADGVDLDVRPWKVVIAAVRDKASELDLGFTGTTPDKETIRRRLAKWAASKLN